MSFRRKGVGIPQIELPALEVSSQLSPVALSQMINKSLIILNNSQYGSVFSSGEEECRLIGNDSKTLDATGVSIRNITHLTAFYIVHADATVGSTRGQNRSGNKLNIKKFL